MTRQERNPCLAAALSYAKLGWLVFPVHSIDTKGGCTCGKLNCEKPAKHPRTEHGYKNASTDDATIRGWWEKSPNSNIGIVTQDFWVLDVDPRNGGLESLSKLQSEIGALPETVKAKTGSGGFHLLFKHPAEKIRNGKLDGFPGIDIKGEGGYIVVSPSLHVSGKRYEWCNGCGFGEVPIAETPSWLLNLLKRPKPHATSHNNKEIFVEGERNNGLTSLAGVLRQKGFSEQAIFVALLEENKTKCKPPLSDEEVQRIAVSVAQYPAGEVENKPSASQASLLIELASEAEFFHGIDEIPFVTVSVKSHRETFLLRSAGFKGWLSRLFYLQHSKVPNAQAMQDALAVLEGKAQFEGPTVPVFVRVASLNGKVYLDLANDSWEVIEISSEGWKVLSDSPVRFRRCRGMLPLPYPEPGGRIDELRPLINVTDDKDFILIVGFLVGALHPSGPFPILVLIAEHGTAKSCATKIIRAIIDPNFVPLRRPPRDERDLMVAATNGWFLAFDNLSGLSQSLSDSFCCLATGGGFGTRSLYTDDQEKLFNAARPIILNGIQDIATKPDLLDRAIRPKLQPIPPEKRREEEEVMSAFSSVHPRILGALCDAVSASLKNYDVVQIPRKPRMADFARRVAAAELAFGWSAGTFLQAYFENYQEAHEAALNSSPFFEPLMALLRKGEIFETATQLLEKLRAVAGNKADQKEWPRSGSALSNDLRKLAPGFRHIGVEITFLQTTGSDSIKPIRIRKVPKNTDAADASVSSASSDASLRVDSVDQNPPDSKGVPIVPPPDRELFDI